MAGKTTITRRLEFDAGHRLLHHEGKCRNAHGHRYVVEVQVAAPCLDSLSRVVDFSVVKGALGGWIDEHLDHGFLVESGDPLGDVLDKELNKVFRFARGIKPTAEAIAHLLYDQATHLLPNLSIKSVTVWETPNCKATYR